MPEITIKPDLKVSAEVVEQTQMQTLYYHGTPVVVPVDSVSDLLTQGGFLLHKPEDLDSLVSEVKALAQAVGDNADRFVQQVLADKMISVREDCEGLTLQKALSELTQRLNDIFSIVHQNYPIAETGETPEEFIARVAADVKYHDYSDTEIIRRYGVDNDTLNKIRAI